MNTNKGSVVTQSGNDVEGCRSQKVLFLQYGIKKAFDTILLKKLEHYWVRGIPLQWFQLYLSGGKQFVSVTRNLSETLGISCGFPQGSLCAWTITFSPTDK